MHTADDHAVFDFDTDGDQRADYWQYQGRDGRKHALAYAASRSGQPDERADLDAVDPNQCPHFIIALDGVPFELVDELHRAGRFRLFYPPARVVCGFPAMTDLALADVFQARRCRAFQALCFDRAQNRLSNSSAGYLSGQNSPWLAKMDYRCSLWWDMLVYLHPQMVFDHELNGLLRAFRAIHAGEARAYSVGSAGLGTRGGRAAISEYLGAVDELCERIVFERHGQVKITLLADHGHNLVENRRVNLDERLRAAGYRPATSLRGPRDVVTISYGLVTYAELYTTDAPGVAQCLVQDDDVEFACYPSDDGVTVADRSGSAHITQGEHGFIYDSSHGDPLKLLPVIEQLRTDGKVSPAGEIDGPALFDATLDHYYPDPLARLWRAFHGEVEYTPDLIVNLRDGACHGWGFFFAMIGKVASTHGSLNRMSSTTFVMTMLGELPPAMRSADVTPQLQRLRAER